MEYIRWYWPDEEVWCYDELDEARWAARHVEVRDGTVVAAASLAEVVAARDAGGGDAVIAYEGRYGVVPEAPFPEVVEEGEPAFEVISSAEFERLWAIGRREG
ncbi:hypothetical protein [Actinoplanes sp. NPDC023714]|uniref:hypothetical protein n=1 Tax=Actinoplanes sp. NPDC023714 TaxID=3154322 RepID=UPI0033E1FD9E